jgi:hypothetical protein
LLTDCVHGEANWNPNLNVFRDWFEDSRE